MDMIINLSDGKKVDASFKGHIIKTDQPLQGGGEDSAPAPFDLFLASIGTCAGIYVKGFCDSRNIPTDNIKILQTMSYNPQTRLIDKIDLDIKLPDDFPEKFREAVINVADLCAVKKHLHNPPTITVKATLEENV
jgi:ribosomal protein S12 methylthiotransferase accessory factor